VTAHQLARRGAASALVLVAGLVAALLLVAGPAGGTHGAVSSTARQTQLAGHRVCAHAAGLPAQCYTVHGNGPWDHKGDE
jgi:hypothetical protein